MFISAVVIFRRFSKRILVLFNSLDPLLLSLQSRHLGKKSFFVIDVIFKITTGEGIDEDWWLFSKPRYSLPYPMVNITIVLH